MLLLCETSLETIQGVIERVQPEIVVIDSIQTMYQEDVSSAPGSVSQVREATSVFMQIAKRMGISIFIVGHVTKEGVVAGPRVLEHMVVPCCISRVTAMQPTASFVASRTDSAPPTRSVFLRCAEWIKRSQKSIGIYVKRQAAGSIRSIVSCSMEGTRPILVEFGT